jgi:hypothetical protein
LIENSRLEAAIFDFLGTSSAAQLFGGRWLLFTALCAFAAFFLLQVLRARALPTEQRTDAPPGRWWPVPLAASLLLCLLIGYSEIVARAGDPFAAPAAPEISATPTLDPQAVPPPR